MPLAGGGFVVVWQRQEPWKPGDGRHSTKYDIYAQRYDAEGKLAGAEFRVHDAPERSQISPRVAALADGGFLVAWSSIDPARSDGQGSGFFARRYAADGTALGDGFRIHDDQPGGSAVAALADGGFLIAWPSDDPAVASGLVVHARRYGPDGVPTDADLRVSDAPDALLSGVQVTVLADGGFVLLCHTSDRSVSGNHGVLARRYAADGTPVGDSFPVHTAPAGDQLFAKAVALPNGGFAIVWQESAEASRFPQHDTYDIFARRYAADGTPLGDGFRVHDAVSDGELFQGATALADGGLLVTWMIFDPSGSGRYLHYARRFTADGAPDGEEFRVHPVRPDDDWTGWAGWAAVAAGVPSQVEGDTGVTEFTVDVTLNTAFSSAQNVAWRVEGSGGHAADAADFEGGVLPSGTLSFAAGETRKTVTVRVASDALVEADEGFTVRLSDASAGLFLATSGAGATIADNDPPVVRGDLPPDRTPVPTGSEFRVNATTADYQSGPSVAAFADGGFVTAWTGRTADGTYDVFAQRFAADGRATDGEFGVNATALGDQNAPSVAALPDGGFVVSWTGTGADGTRDIFARRFAADGAAAGGEFRVDATPSGDQYGPKVAALADGGFVASWVLYDADGTRDVFARRFAADGSAAGGEFHSGSAAAGNEYSPSVAGLADGGFVLSWYSSGRGVLAQRFAADGAAAGGEFRVNATTPGNASRPDVAALADGGFVVSWDSNTGNRRADVFAQRYGEDGAATGGEFRVRESSLGMNWQPAVTGLADGGFVVSWVNSEPVGSAGLIDRDIVARRFAADGAAAGGEFRVTAATGGGPQAPSVAALPGGGFVVAWDGADAAGATDVLARVFSAPGPAGTVHVSADDAAKAESDAGTTAFTFTVRMDAASDAQQSVRWQVAGAGADPATAADFVGGALPSGTLVFAPGETSKAVTVAVAGDAAVEADERFAVALSDASSGLALGVASASAAILNDDAVPPAPPNMPVVRGTALDDSFAKVPGRAAYEGLGGHDSLDFGGAGFRGAHATAGTDGSCVLTHGGDAAVLRGVEEVRFADGRLVFDADDPAAKVLRLYEAALDRLPDQGGLNVWIDAVRDGQPLAELARAFLGSTEFQARFGGAGTDDGAFVDRLYQNALGRAGDAEGRAFWVDRLDTGAATRADVLAAFSEGPENRAATSDLVRSGIWDRSEEAMEVARLYDAAFGRLTDAEGLAFWKGRVGARRRFAGSGGRRVRRRRGVPGQARGAGRRRLRRGALREHVGPAGRPGRTRVLDGPARRWRGAVRGGAGLFRKRGACRAHGEGHRRRGVGGVRHPVRLNAGAATGAGAAPASPIPVPIARPGGAAVRLPGVSADVPRGGAGRRGAGWAQARLRSSAKR
ncbi:hypothetical protein GCM10009416_46320 [Craurococcus roseus]|uniref:Calx-beta domain-containing protein n=1 Tax=Craurococcus roseus TaxID=77585 RepID=A0ABN1G3K4_9PROT